MTAEICCDHHPGIDRCYCFRCYPKRSKTGLVFSDPMWHQPGVYQFVQDGWRFLEGLPTPIYIGQTGRCVGRRVLEHERDAESPVYPLVSERSAWLLMFSGRPARRRADERWLIRAYMGGIHPLLNRKLPRRR